MIRKQMWVKHKITASNYYKKKDSHQHKKTSVCDIYIRSSLREVDLKMRQKYSKYHSRGKSFLISKKTQP